VNLAGQPPAPRSPNSVVAGYNILTLAALPLPARRDERRRLGLPARSSAARGETRRAQGWHVVRLEGLPARLAGFLGRLMRACGGSAEAVPGRRTEGRTLVLTGDDGVFSDFLGRAARRPESRPAAGEMQETLRRSGAHRPMLPLAFPDRTILLGKGTCVMGILNVTPDSFSDGGLYLDPRRALERALRLADEGADLVDIGGESTRPGAAPVSLQEELRRVLPVLESIVPALRKRGAGRPRISIDTRRSEVARRAVAAGAEMVNDISGMTFDPAMPAVVAESGVPVVIQHIRGTPQTMQVSPRYDSLLPAIARFLRRQIELATRAGVRGDRIVVDPGLGFGKRHRDNLAILRHLAVLRSLGCPILVGASRKSFLGGGDLPPTERLEGSLAAEALAIMGGADIIRAHDVRQAVRVARLCDAVLRGPVAGR
jgi:dihydropteroate synthase